MFSTPWLRRLIFGKTLSSYTRSSPSSSKNESKPFKSLRYVDSFLSFGSLPSVSLCLRLIPRNLYHALSVSYGIDDSTKRYSIAAYLSLAAPRTTVVTEDDLLSINYLFYIYVQELYQNVNMDEILH
ncbi:hypothetical protein AVEN_34338-1 [Araneus ventricosus]|uniref:Uncharacterized protein n=1 Tax=Araneus ventricosus TaxID=182803 RepID=A0A4Y2G2G1_ARAVE|nr:hypothetical protein AVEN_34338-1 [Araneus ventricosus]